MVSAQTPVKDTMPWTPERTARRLALPRAACCRPGSCSRSRSCAA